MDYEKIILDLLHRIVVLEERVEKLEKAAADAKTGEGESSEVYAAPELPSGSKKYRFLSEYLYGTAKPQVRLSFEEIEQILGFELPDSACVHRAFWANTTSHSIALSWLSVGYSVVEADLQKKYIVFEKDRKLMR